MEKYKIIALVCLLLILLNRMLAVSQQVRLNKDLAQLKKRGPVCGVGLAKSPFLGSRVGVLITDRAGDVQEVYHVCGKSVFSGYKLDVKFPYADCYQAKCELESRNKLSLQERAYLSAASYISDGLSAQNVSLP
ncbi:MAG: transcriptional regulator GutM [Clostridia bacterium]